MTTRIAITSSLFLGIAMWLLPSALFPQTEPKKPRVPPSGASSFAVIVQCTIVLTSIVQRNKSLSINPCRTPRFLKGPPK